MFSISVRAVVKTENQNLIFRSKMFTIFFSHMTIEPAILNISTLSAILLTNLMIYWLNVPSTTVDTGVQVDNFTRPLSVAVQTDESELYRVRLTFTIFYFCYKYSNIDVVFVKVSNKPFLLLYLINHYEIKNL